MENDSERVRQTENIFPRNIRVQATIFLLITLNFIILSFPYYVKGYIVPFGWDTAWYVRNIRLVVEQGFPAMFQETREINFYCVLEYFTYSAFHTSFVLIEKILPLIIGVSFSLVNFMIAKKFSKSWNLSLLAMGFSVIDFNIIRMVQDLHRNLFCFLLIQIGLFLVLPDLLEKNSKRKVVLFVVLLVLAGISQMETLAFVVFVLSLLFLFYLRERSFKKAKLLAIFIAVPTLLVILLELPFLPNYLRGTIFLDPSIKFTYEDFIAPYWGYFTSFGSALFPFYFLGLFYISSNFIKGQRDHFFTLILFWNLVAIVCSFIPWFGIKIPGYRFLLLITTPIVSTFGIAKLFSKRHITLKKLAFVTVLVVLTVTTQIAYVSANYKSWLSNNEYEKLTWIANNKKDDCTFVLYFDNARVTYNMAEMRRFWVQAIVGTRTNVYFGEVNYLLLLQPTFSENEYLNKTSLDFWSAMKNFTLENDVYLIDDWYNITDADKQYLEETACKGVYQVKK